MALASENITAYLRKKGYADHVVRGGLASLVHHWELVAEGLARSDPAYIMYEEFLNDLDGRRILRECIERLAPSDLAEISARVAEADRVFSENTVAISRCVWGDATADEYGYEPIEDWYYYRRPRASDDGWPKEFL